MQENPSLVMKNLFNLLIKYLAQIVIRAPYQIAEKYINNLLTIH